MLKKIVFWTLVAVVFPEGLADGTPRVAEQSEARQTVWDGVYSDEQAARGQTAFEGNCAACHAAEDGRQPGAGLTGTAFMERWREYDLGSLFGVIRDTMPRDTPGSLSDGTYLDIVARILAANSFPAGGEELTLEKLEDIQIEGPDGPQPLPSGALSQLVGCLAQEEGSNWILTDATEPARTNRARGSTDEELIEAQAKPLGSQIFGLQGFQSIRGGFTPEEHRGERMQVKGYLMRLPDSQRIDLLSMETLAESCAP